MPKVICLMVKWYENGQKFLEGKYTHEIKTGVWTEWYKTGQKYAELYYDNG
ncbi:MAG: hypothetical protein IPJ81_13710 [Chitinophagaceae bacterium]|nr:hypothetical protein [Chitinophagaceae bacterium]